jgi:pimeloyl-ACP methyl ester carboxylesterase
MTDEVGSRLLELAGGRTLEVWEGGDADGVPVVFQHGTPSGRLQARLGEDAARRSGVRLVSFNRPGYGRSTDTPPSLASVGVDTLVVADALGIEEFAVLGASGGGPYAVATGLADQVRVRAVGLAGGVGPWRFVEPPDPTDPDLPILALADAGDIEGALKGFRADAGGRYEKLLALPDPAMTEDFFSGVPEEDAGWLTPENKRLFGLDLRDTLRTYDGYARDNVAWGAEWDIDPARLEVPTWLWFGDLDLMVPPSHGVWYAERVPNSTLVTRAGNGHGSTIFEYWDDMLTTLRDALQPDGS